MPRTDAVYLCHAYLTKVPLGAIEPFVQAFTLPGETVVDPFAGSGMTGLAAQRLGRRAVVSDISVLGRHIGTGYAAKVAASDLKVAMREVVSNARKAVGEIYQTRRQADGHEVEQVRTVWSFTYICPTCTASIVYFDHLSPTGSPPKSCPSCDAPFVRRSWTRGPDVPVEVVVRGPSGKQVSQPVGAFDQAQIASAEADQRLASVPSLTIGTEREMFSRSGLGKVGLSETKAFFSARNALVLTALRSSIMTVPDPNIRQKLLFAFTASLARASRRYQWGPKRPLNAQNQTYYIAPVYYEWNVFELFERKVEASIKATALLSRGSGLFPDDGTFDYVTASATRLDHLEDESVDYVFTDPPFGSNLFYSDMSLFHEAWLDGVTDPSDEAVVFTTGNRKKTSAARYETLLTEAFREAFRVLKPGRAMSVVFGNSSGEVWGFVQRALREAGFADAPIHVAVLDKGQRSVKGLNSGSEKVATVDLVMTVEKPKSPTVHKSRELIQGDVGSLIRVALNANDLDARNPSHVYARVLKEAIAQHCALDNLHLADVLTALFNAGYVLDPKSGLLIAPMKAA